MTNTNSDKYYKESGEIGLGAAYMIIGGILAAALLGAIYGYAVFYIPLIYLNILIAIGFGWGLGYVVSKVSHAGKTRNRIAVIAIAAIIGVLGSYFGWVSWIFAASEETFLALLPEDIMQVMANVAEEGAWSIFDFTPMGEELYFVWIVEAAIILGAAIMAAKSGTDEQVFCDTCDEWLTTEHLGPMLSSTNDHQGLKSALENKKFEALTSLPHVHSTAEPRIVAAVAHCDGCNKEIFLTVRQEIEAVNDKGETELNINNILTHLRITPEEYQQLLSWRDSFKQEE